MELFAKLVTGLLAGLFMELVTRLFTGLFLKLFTGLFMGLQLLALTPVPGHKAEATRINKAHTKQLAVFLFIYMPP